MSQSAVAPLKLPPKVSGEKPGSGHMEEFGVNFARFMMRCNAECGELAEFNMGGQQTVLMSGPEAQEAFLKTLDLKLSRAAAYQATVPVFGKGVIFDAPPDKMKAQLKIQVDALRYQNMKNYSTVISKEVEDWVAGWGDEGDPYMQQPVFEARDKALIRLQALIGGIIAERRASSHIDYGDALETFMAGTYTDGSRLTENEITGLVIATMFAGHHTSSGTATWTLTELARQKAYSAEVSEELQALFKIDSQITFESLREIPKLEAFIEEVLRLHPPLVLLMRRVIEDIDYNGTLIEAGKTVAISIYGSHRNTDYFPDPEKFDPYRPKPDTLFAYIPFGGGPHKCAGNAFAMMQMKAIFAALLPRYEFELVDPDVTYQDDLSAIVLKPTGPCRLRYTKRK